VEKVMSAMRFFYMALALSTFAHATLAMVVGRVGFGVALLGIFVAWAILAAKEFRCKT
jgi:hypothetical protein